MTGFLYPLTLFRAGLWLDVFRFAERRISSTPGPAHTFLITCGKPLRPGTNAAPRHDGRGAYSSKALEH